MTKIVCKNLQEFYIPVFLGFCKTDANSSLYTAADSGAGAGEGGGAAGERGHLQAALGHLRAAAAPHGEVKDGEPGDASSTLPLQV